LGVTARAMEFTNGLSRGANYLENNTQIFGYFNRNSSLLVARFSLLVPGFSLLARGDDLLYRLLPK